MTTNSRLSRLTTTATPWLTDGGLETELIFHHDIDLPHFASLHALDTDAGRAALERYFEPFIDIAREADTGFVLDTATWRSGAYWAPIVGRSEAELETANHAAVDFAKALRAKHETPDLPIVINGAVGPAGDGYNPERLYTPDEAEALHARQVKWLVDAGVDMVTAVTLTHPGEAIGFARAAETAGIPFVIGFTTERDGRLPNGQTLGAAISEVDEATDGAAMSFMINCAHPDHFSGALEGDWLSRISAIRGNASRMSHAELDEAEELDDGDPSEFGELYDAIAPKLPNLRVIGGCCGTDHRHVGCAAHHLCTHEAA